MLDKTLGRVYTGDMLPLLPLLVACKHPDPAPTKLEDLIGWMFTHADDDDTTSLDEGTVNLSTWMDSHFDETLPGYTVNNLSESEVEGVGVGYRDLSGLQGVAVGYPYTTEADQVADALMASRDADNVDSTDENSTVAVEGSTTCFADKSCDWAVFDADVVTDMGFGITMETWTRYQYRRYQTDAGEVLLQRSWSQQSPVLTTSLFSIDQTYQIWVLVPEGGSWRSIQGEWVDAQVLGSLNMDFVMEQWVKQLISLEESNDTAAAAF